MTTKMPDHLARMPPGGYCQSIKHVGYGWQVENFSGAFPKMGNCRYPNDYIRNSTKGCRKDCIKRQTLSV